MSKGKDGTEFDIGRWVRWASNRQARSYLKFELTSNEQRKRIPVKAHQLCEVCFKKIPNRKFKEHKLVCKLGKT